MARKTDTAINFDPMNVFLSFDPAKAGEQFTRLLGEFKTPAIDVKAFAAAQQKGLKAASAANQAAFDGVRAIAERQAVMVRETVEATSGAVEALRSVTDPKEAMEKQADFVRGAYDKAVRDTNELRELAVKTGSAVVAPISDHIRTSLDELVAMTASVDKNQHKGG